MSGWRPLPSRPRTMRSRTAEVCQAALCVCGAVAAVLCTVCVATPLQSRLSLTCASASVRLQARRPGPARVADRGRRLAQATCAATAAAAHPAAIAVAVTALVTAGGTGGVDRAVAALGATDSGRVATGASVVGTGGTVGARHRPVAGGAAIGATGCHATGTAVTATTGGSGRTGGGRAAVARCDDRLRRRCGGCGRWWCRQLRRRQLSVVTLSSTRVPPRRLLPIPPLLSLGVTHVLPSAPARSSASAATQPRQPQMSQRWTWAPPRPLAAARCLARAPSRRCSRQRCASRSRVHVRSRCAWRVPLRCAATLCARCSRPSRAPGGVQAHQRLKSLDSKARAWRQRRTYPVHPCRSPSP